MVRLPHASQQRPSGGHARRRSSRRLCALRLPHEGSSSSRRLCVLRLPSELCVLRLPCESSPAGARRKLSWRLYNVLRLPRERQPRPQRRPRAPQLLQDALCAAPATRKASRTLCVLRLPPERQPRPQRRPRAPQLLQDALCTAPATRKAAAAPPPATRAAAPPGRSVYCACHPKGSRSFRTCGLMRCEEL